MLWWFCDDHRPSAPARELLADPDNSIHVSADRHILQCPVNVLSVSRLDEPLTPHLGKIKESETTAAHSHPGDRLRTSVPARSGYLMS